MNFLDELVDEVLSRYKPDSDLLTLREVLAGYSGTDWQEKCTFDSSGYQRVPLFQNKHFELLLLCWDKRQGSLYHDHPSSGCVLKVLSGALRETRAQKQKNDFVITKQTICKAGAVSYMHDRLGWHKIENVGDAPAASLHLYAPVGYKPHYFEG